MNHSQQVSMVHWWLFSGPLGQSTVLEQMAALGGGTVFGGRATFPWRVGARRYVLDVLGINDNHVVANLEDARGVEYEHIREAGVIIVRVAAGCARTRRLGFRQRGRELRTLLAGLGRNPDEVSVLFMLDRTKNQWVPGLGWLSEPVEPEHQPEDLIPLFQWPRCAHVITNFELCGEGIAEAVDAAVALWERYR